MTQADIIDLLQEHDRLSARKIKDLLGDITLATVRRSVRSLRRYGIITAVEKSKVEGGITLHYSEYSLNRGRGE